MAGQIANSLVQYANSLAKANIYTLKTRTDAVVSIQVNIINGELTVSISETPTFVQGVN